MGKVIAWFWYFVDQFGRFNDLEDLAEIFSVCLTLSGSCVVMAVIAWVGAPAWAIVLGFIGATIVGLMLVSFYNYINSKFRLETGKYSLIQSSRNREVWYFVIEEILVVNSSKKNPLALDISLNYFRQPIHVIGEPLEEWETLKAKDLVEPFSFIQMPVTLEPGKPLRGYVAFRIPNAFPGSMFAEEVKDSFSFNQITLLGISLNLTVEDLHIRKTKDVTIFSGNLTFTWPRADNWYSNKGNYTVSLS
jgi:hypothetical protein